MKSVIDTFKDIVVQIATPYSTGTGFLLRNENIIVTNEHVVRDNREVIVNGSLFERTSVRVIFTDPQFDLAFLEVPPLQKDLKPTVLGDSNSVSDGDIVVAVGHPMGLRYSFTQGIVSNSNRIMEGQNQRYVQTDAAINLGNSGGPLVNKNGDIIGVNTSIYQNTNNIGFALQVDYLKQSIEEFKQGTPLLGTRCISCSNIVFETRIVSNYCNHCGAKIKLPTVNEIYEPTGVNLTIEQLLTRAGHNVSLSRMGPSNWEIRQGSASINISYYEKAGLIVGDAYLCQLPKKNIKPLYKFLLRQNYELEGLMFSINPKGQDIILSLMIYDRYLNIETGFKLFKNLFDKADYYDDILVNEYGGIWKDREEE